MSLNLQAVRVTNSLRLWPYLSARITGSLSLHCHFKNSKPEEPEYISDILVIGQ